MNDYDKIIDKLTLEEKVDLLVGDGYWKTNGIARLGIKGISISDGPHGLRHQISGFDNLGIVKSEPAVCFPTGSTIGCSFDRKLMREIGEALASDAISQGIDIVLGPAINMKRSPLCGRNFEYFSEDPVLSGELAAAYVEGIQENGVGVSVKHFAANGQETLRLVCDSIIDEQTLRELYLEAFRICIEKAQPETIMPAYNLLNGVYCCENQNLLNEIAREEWGFDGAFISDWGAQASNSRSLPCGLDLVMPGPRPDYPDSIKKLVNEGVITKGELNSAVSRILDLIEKHSDKRECSLSIEERLAIAQKAAEKSAVLLKNDNLLPLAKDVKIAVIGAFAKKPNIQGGGSSNVNSCETISLFDALSKRVGSIDFAQGYNFRRGTTTSGLIAEACEVAKSSDVCICVIGLLEGAESEGRDRLNMQLPESHNELVRAICKANPNTCVVLQCGSAVELPWIDDSRAIILAGLGGSRCGEALARLLLGSISPSGKLAETWPYKLADTPSYKFYPSRERQALYAEAIFNGYRYYDTAEIDPLFEFGFGLSYAMFEYSNLEISSVENTFDIEFTITNIGKVEAIETPQLYLAPPVQASYMHAVRTLKDFCKIMLKAGESKLVKMHLDRHAFEHWDTDEHGWKVEEGKWCIQIGASSRDIRLSEFIDVNGQTSSVKIPDTYVNVRPAAFNKHDFVSLYGSSVPPEPKTGRPFTINSLVGEIRRTIWGRFAVWVIVKGAPVFFNHDPIVEEAISKVDDQTCLREMNMTGIDMRLMEGVVDIFNFHFVRGIRLIKVGLKSMRKNSTNN